MTCYSGGAVLKQVENALVVQVTNFFPVTGGPINPAEREVVVEAQEGGPFRMVGGQEMICALTGF